MSICVLTREGTRIVGDTALDVVRQMNDRALIGESDAWRYMVVMAQRIKRLGGAPVRATSPGAFLCDLAAAELINLVEATTDTDATAPRRPLHQA